MVYSEDEYKLVKIGKKTFLYGNNLISMEKVFIENSVNLNKCYSSIDACIDLSRIVIRCEKKYLRFIEKILIDEIKKIVNISSDYAGVEPENYDFEDYNNLN